MAYLVKILPRAERDLEYIFETIHAVESRAALAWYKGLRVAILTLEQNPDRCPPAPEGGRFRHLLYGRKPNVYRVIYRVREPQQIVDRHGARNA